MHSVAHLVSNGEAGGSKPPVSIHEGRVAQRKSAEAIAEVEGSSHLHVHHLVLLVSRQIHPARIGEVRLQVPRSTFEGGILIGEFRACATCPLEQDTAAQTMTPRVGRRSSYTPASGHEEGGLNPPTARQYRECRSKVRTGPSEGSDRGSSPRAPTGNMVKAVSRRTVDPRFLVQVQVLPLDA